jgi:hypothetical protein
MDSQVRLGIHKTQTVQSELRTKFRLRCVPKSDLCNTNLLTSSQIIVNRIRNHRNKLGLNRSQAHLQTVCLSKF